MHAPSGKKALAAAAFAALLASGCLGPTAPPANGPSAFDGEGAYAFAAGLVTGPDGQPRFRVPGTPSHEAAAEWLAKQVDVPGWQPWYSSGPIDNFDGPSYEALDKMSLSRYTEDCPKAQRDRLATLHFSNVAAWRRGPASENRTLVLMAHWDSKRLATLDPDPSNRTHPVLGANDGASGVGVLLQFMRHVSDRGTVFPFHVLVLFVDGEDGFEDCHPVAGSLWFVSTAKPRDYRVLLLDMVGDPEARFKRDHRSMQTDGALVDILWHHGHRNGLGAHFLNQSASVEDDTTPFWDKGYPGVDLVDAGRPGGFPPYWHTRRDTMANLDAAFMGKVGQAVHDAVTDPLFSAAWPLRPGAP